MRLALEQVVECFLNGERGGGSSLTSSGTALFSYGVEIGQWRDGKVFLPDAQKWYSRTTSRHRNMLRRMASSRGIETKE